MIPTAGAPFSDTTPANTAFITVRPYGNGDVEFQIKPSSAAAAISTTLVPAGTNLRRANGMTLL